LNFPDSTAAEIFSRTTESSFLFIVIHIHIMEVFFLPGPQINLGRMMTVENPAAESEACLTSFSASILEREYGPNGSVGYG
jgi:hypothetical protein